MNFMIEVSVPLVIGLSVSAYLQPVTIRLLLDLCGTRERSAFWIRIMTILMAGLPLLLSLALGYGGNEDAVVGEVARHALMMSTLGIVVAVCGMTKVIMVSVSQNVSGTERAEIS